MKISLPHSNVTKVLLVFLSVGVLGFTGWYVVQAMNEDDKPAAPTKVSTAEPNDKKPQASKQPADETAAWTAYSPMSKLFTIKLPDGWKFYDQDGGTLYTQCGTSDCLTYTKGVAAEIKTTAGGRDGVSGLMIAVDKPASTTRFGSDYQKLGSFQAGTLTGDKYFFEQKAAPQGIGLPQGSKEYSYYFIKDGQGIFIDYSQLPDEPDRLSVVEKAIATLR